MNHILQRVSSHISVLELLHIIPDPPWDLHRPHKIY